jgi:hypothetical protein
VIEKEHLYDELYRFVILYHGPETYKQPYIYNSFYCVVIGETKNYQILFKVFYTFHYTPMHFKAMSYITSTFFKQMYKNSCGLVVKVFCSLLRDHYSSPTLVTTMFLHMKPVPVGSGKRTRK